MGYDAYGCDVGEWWGKDHEHAHADYGVTYVPPPDVASRLRCFSPAELSLPFPPNHFDLCFSDQVMEHVFDHTTAFRQMASVLKPDAISVHRFPGPNMLFEGHVYLPLPAICHNKLYLTACALVGRSAPSQRRLSWREVLDSNVQVMQTVNYRSKRHLRACARQANVNIAFLESKEILLRDVGTAAKVVARARRFGLDSLLAKSLSLFSQRYMVLTHA
jgi:SAM-dependent methyltransferase